MNFVIPMAGHGSRFVDAGYKLPKMLLKAHGKTLLEWSLESLPLELATTLIFIGLQEHERTFKISEQIVERFPDLNCKFIFLPQTTRGQAETVYLALEKCEDDKPLVIFNIDTYFQWTTLADRLLDPNNDGVLNCFESTENRFSFAKTDQTGQYVVEVKEKEVISSHALTGLYTFKKVADFVETYEHHNLNNLTTKGELYIAPMYNYLIAKGKKYVLDVANKHYILGIPQEYEHFLALENQ